VVYQNARETRGRKRWAKRCSHRERKKRAGALESPLTNRVQIAEVKTLNPEANQVVSLMGKAPYG